MLYTYLLVAYLIAPTHGRAALWYHPFSDDQARITTASDGHPGDPLNAGLIGSEAEVTHGRLTEYCGLGCSAAKDDVFRFHYPTPKPCSLSGLV